MKDEARFLMIRNLSTPIATLIAATGAIFVTSGCGNSSGSSTPATSTSSQVKNLSQLPKITAPVSSSSGSTLNETLPSGAHRLAGSTGASTGLALSKWVDTNWSSHSAGMCQAGRLVSELLTYGGVPDALVCEIGVLEKHQLVTTPVDGQTYYYQLGYGVNGSWSYPSENFKFTVSHQKGAISSFSLYDCTNTGGATPNFVQDFYINHQMTSSGTNVNFVENYSYSNPTYGTYSYGISIGAKGNIDADGNWVSSKSVTSSMSNSFVATAGSTQSSSSTYSESETMTQTSDSVLVNGFVSGTYGSYTDTSQIVAAAQTLNTDELSEFALGNGSATFQAGYILAGTSSPQSSAVTESWNGDTQTNLAQASSGEYYSQVGSSDLPSVTTVTTSYPSGGTWDCTTPSGTNFTQINLFDGFAPDGYTIEQVQGDIEYTCGGFSGLSSEMYAGCYDGN